MGVQTTIVGSADKLAERRKLHIGATITVVLLTLVVCLGIGLLYINWQPGSTLNVGLGLIGYIAMALGLLAAILLGVGIILLIHRNKHRGE